MDVSNFGKSIKINQFNSVHHRKFKLKNYLRAKLRLMTRTFLSCLKSDNLGPI